MPTQGISFFSTEFIEKILILYITYNPLSFNIVQRKYNLPTIMSPIKSSTP